MSVLESGDIAISHGMQGQDAHFETLMALWEDLQLSSFDLASQPDCDLLSFAQTSFFFGVITVNRDSNSEGKLPPLPPPLAESNISTRPSVGPTNSSGSGQAAVRHKPLDSWPEEESADSRKPLFPDRGRLANEPILGLGGNFMTPVEWSPNLNWGVTETFQREWDVAEAAPDKCVVVGLQIFHDSDCCEQSCVAKANLAAGSKVAPSTPTPENDTHIMDWPVPQDDAWNLTQALGSAARAGSSRIRVPEPTRALPPHPSGTGRFDNDLLSSRITPFTPFATQTHASSSASRWNSRSEIRDELYAGAKSAAARKPVGIIYLTAPPLSISPPQQIGEMNFGIILGSAHRGKGYAREAIQLVLKYAFNDAHCHRIQASLLSLSSKDRMVSLLTQLRFGHEGTKRRSFFNPMIREWQDVTTLAILDTDWAMRGFFKPAPKTLWDELFARHQRERDELLRWEEDQSRLKRTASSETIRAVRLTLGTDSEAESAASSTLVNKGKKRMAPSDWNHDPYDGSSSDSDGDLGAAGRSVLTGGRYIPRVSSPTLSEISLESVPTSLRSTPSTPSTPSVSGSDWDMMDSASSGSSSFGDEE